MRADAPEDRHADGIVAAVVDHGRKGLADKVAGAVRRDEILHRVGRRDLHPRGRGLAEDRLGQDVGRHAADRVNAVGGLDRRAVDGERFELAAFARLHAHGRAAAAAHGAREDADAALFIRAGGAEREAGEAHACGGIGRADPVNGHVADGPGRGEGLDIGVVLLRALGEICAVFVHAGETVDAGDDALRRFADELVPGAPFLRRSFPVRLSAVRFPAARFVFSRFPGELLRSDRRAHDRRFQSEKPIGPGQGIHVDLRAVGGIAVRDRSGAVPALDLGGGGVKADRVGAERRIQNADRAAGSGARRQLRLRLHPHLIGRAAGVELDRAAVGIRHGKRALAADGQRAAVAQRLRADGRERAAADEAEPEVGAHHRQIEHDAVAGEVRQRQGVALIVVLRSGDRQIARLGMLVGREDHALDRAVRRIEALVGRSRQRDGGDGAPRALPVRPVGRKGRGRGETQEQHPAQYQTESFFQLHGSFLQRQLSAPRRGGAFMRAGTEKGTDTPVFLS